MSLSMTVERVNSTCAVAALHGPLSMGRALKSVEGGLQQLIDEGVRQLVVDLTDSAHSDSAGLGFLVYTYGLITQKGGTIRLCGVSDRIVDMLVTTRTDDILPCDPSSADSLQKLSAGHA